MKNRAALDHRSGWRENQLKLERYRAMYGTRDEWNGWFEMFTAGQEHDARIWGITEQERNNVKLIDYWPLPSQMLSQCNPETRNFLQFLNDWFYRELSQESHLSFPGLAERAVMLISLDKAEKFAEENMQHYRSKQIIIAVTLLLAICTEVEHYFSFGFKQRIVVLWGILSDGFPLSKEVYEKRYANVFV